MKLIEGNNKMSVHQSIINTLNKVAQDPQSQSHLCNQSTMLLIAIDRKLVSKSVQSTNPSVQSQDKMEVHIRHSDRKMFQ